LALVHDDSKAQPEYAIRYYGSRDEVLGAPAMEIENLTAVGFRGDVYKGQRCEVEEVAALTLELARARIPVRLVVDELNRAVTSGGKAIASPSLLEAMTAGRTMGLSVLWGTQIPQRVPAPAWDLSSSIGIFQLGEKAMRYLDESLLLDSEMLDVVPTLGVGEFVLHRPGEPWDRTVYRF
jgi:hypothetical protein